MTITISERSVVLDAWRWLAAAIPPSFVGGLEGRVQSIRLPGSLPVKRGERVRLVLGAELVLSRRMSLPLSARRDLAGAIRLLIETETPFSPDELLVHAERLPSRGDTRGASYQVRMVAREALLAAMADAGIRPAQVVAIADGDAPARTDFWRLAFPVRAAMRWTVLLPITAIAVCLVSFVAQSHFERETVLAELNRVAAERLAQLRQLTDQLETRRQQLAGNAEVAAALSTSTSAFNALGRLRTNLAADTEVSRIELNDQTLLVSISAPDALAAAQRLGATMPAQIEGAITTAPGTGFEQAMVRIELAKAGSRD